MKNSHTFRILKSLAIMAGIASTVAATAYKQNTVMAFFVIMGILLLIGMLKGFGLFNVSENLFTGMAIHKAETGFDIQDTTYAGEAASTFIVKAITSNDTVQGGHVYVKDGIKKRFTIPRWDADYEDFVQDRAATPVSKGVVDVDGQELDPADYMIYFEFNPRDYEAHWFATMLKPELIDRTLPSTVESVTVQEVLKRHDKYLNKALWNSDKSFAKPSIYRYYDGYIKKATTAADTLIVSSPTTLTVDNIQGELLKGYQLIPAALRYDPEMKFFVSYATFDLYAQSQIAQTYKGIDITKEGSDLFKGRKVVKIADLPDNLYFIAKGKADPSSNLWVGMNSVDDAKLSMKPVANNSELWFVKMNMKVDVQIGWNGETVLYNGN